jgi:preprotein translocase subunit SecG
MDLLIGLLTFVLVLNCALLILLILIQLPKKDAGAGLAFGGAASDALFGAGTGTVLTKVTRHATTFFLVLAFALSVMQSHRARAKRTSIENLLDSQAAAAAQPASVPATAPAMNLTNLGGALDESAAPAATDATATTAATLTNAADAATTTTPTTPATETVTNAPANPAAAEETTAPTPPPENP